MEQIKLMEQFLNIAFDTTKILTTTSEKDEKYRLLMDLISKRLDFDYAELWLLDDQGKYLFKSPITSVKNPSLQAFSQYSFTVEFAFDEGLPGISWARKKASEFKITTGVTMPIFTYDVLDAVFFFFSIKPKKKHKLFMPLINNISTNLGYNLMQNDLKIELANIQEQLEALKDVNLETINRIFSLKDPYTITHQRGVADFALKIAGKLNLDKHVIKQIHIASLLHDLGKIAIPQEILSKPMLLNKEEYDLVKRHPQTGYDVIRHFPFDEEIKRMVLEHHERLDGSGYPNHKKAKDILLGSQIIAIADMVDAMTSHRPYRPALSPKQVVSELNREKGIRLNKEFCEIAIDILKTY